MLQHLRRGGLAAAVLLLTLSGPPAASAHVAAVTLDGLRDPAYVLLAQDPTGDLAPSFSTNAALNWADLSNLYVTADPADLWVYVDLPNYTNNSTGEFGLAIDTDGLPASGGQPDPNGNAITYAYTSTHNNVGTSPVITSATLLPDAVIRGSLFSPANGGGGYTELRHWNAISSTWDGVAVNWGGITNTALIGSNIAFQYGAGLELKIPFADLGVSPTQTLQLEFYATGKIAVGHHQGAWDTIPSDTQPLTDTISTVQRRLATFPVISQAAFSAAAFETFEAAGSAPITITVTPASFQPMSITLRTADGTASSADYSPISQTVTFAPGQSDQVIALHVLTDTIIEADETVLLNLSQPSGVQLGEPSSAILTIHDSPPGRHPLYLPFMRK